MRSGLNTKRPRNNRNNLRRGPGHHGGPRTLDSNGPDIKIRGSASQIFEKYLVLARDAQSSGDRIMAENYLQHAEHYYRVLNPQPTGAKPAAPEPGAVPADPDTEGDAEGGEAQEKAEQPQP